MGLFSALSKVTRVRALTRGPGAAGRNYVRRKAISAVMRATSERKRT